MRPSQVTYQGRFYYHCAFSAPANWRCIHIYAVGIYICMHVAECTIRRERRRDWFMLGLCAVILANGVIVCVWSSAVHCVRQGGRLRINKKGGKRKKNLHPFRQEWLLTPNYWLVLLQDAQLYPSVATASALICWSSWLWPWTLPMRFTWWLTGSLELRSGSVVHSITCEVTHRLQTI